MLSDFGPKPMDIKGVKKEIQFLEYLWNRYHELKAEAEQQLEEHRGWFIKYMTTIGINVEKIKYPWMEDFNVTQGDIKETIQIMSARM